MNIAPTLTIALPVYQRTFGFDEALNSAIAVKGCSEILVVDDCSSHNEFEQICLTKKDSRIRYERNDRNVGIFGNWNRCASLATSDFIAILCSDDVICADIYDRFNKAIAQFNDIDVFFGAFAVFSKSVANGRIVWRYPLGRITSLTLLQDAAKRGAAFPVLSVIRREKLLQYPFVSKPHSGNDSFWIYSNALSFNLYSDEKPLSYWRRHPNQDAKISESITTDSWPLMYRRIGEQLRSSNCAEANAAESKAKGVILSWLLNDKTGKGYKRRLRTEEGSENFFLREAKGIIERDWLLSGILASNLLSPFYYNLGRIVRKLGIYRPPLS